MLYHVSHSKIEKIEKSLSIFDDVFFFSPHGFYYRVCLDECFHYVIDDSELRMIEAWEFKSHDIENAVNDLSDEFEISSDEARSLIVGDEITSDEIESRFDGEAHKILQVAQANLAKSLGYDGCQASDENGDVVMMCMYGRDDLLNLVDKDFEG